MAAILTTSANQQFPSSVSPDGKRFLMPKDSAAGDPNATPVSMVLVEHWFEELKQRVNGK